VIELQRDEIRFLGLFNETFNKKKSSIAPKIFLGIFSFFGMIMVSVFLFLGFQVSLDAVKRLVEVFRGVLLGKISLLLFPLLFGLSIFALCMSAIFIIVPLVIVYFILTQLLGFDNTFININFLENNQLLSIIGGVAFFFIPLLVALIRILRDNKSHIKFKSSCRRVCLSFGGKSCICRFFYSFIGGYRCYG